MPLSRTNLGFLCWPEGRRLAEPLRGGDTPDEGIADQTRHDGHSVLGEAEFQVPLIPETFQPPCRTVVPQRPRGAREITLDDAPCPPVKFNIMGLQPVEDGP